VIVPPFAFNDGLITVRLNVFSVYCNSGSGPACTVKLYVVDAFGGFVILPVITPFDARFNPGGSAPEISVYERLLTMVSFFGYLM
jgi:hypothetical protein